MLLLLLTALCIAAYGEFYSYQTTRQFPPQGRMINWNGAELHVQEHGQTDGKSALLIHGASANGREFLGTLVPHLQDDFHLIIPDRPGHGHSDRPPEAHKLAEQANAMAAVLEATGTQKAIIIAHSFGSAVALRLALDHPEKVSGIIVLAPASHSWGGKTNIHNRMVANPVYGPLYARIVTILGPSRAQAGMENTFAPQSPPPGYADSLGLPMLFRPRTFRANGQDVSALHGELEQQELRYADLKVPLIVFSGERDRVVSPEIHAERLVETVEGARLESLPDTGHMPHHFHGEDIAARAREMVSSRLP